MSGYIYRPTSPMMPTQYTEQQRQNGFRENLVFYQLDSSKGNFVSLAIERAFSATNWREGLGDRKYNVRMHAAYRTGPLALRTVLPTAEDFTATMERFATFKLDEDASLDGLTYLYPWAHTRAQYTNPSKNTAGITVSLSQDTPALGNLLDKQVPECLDYFNQLSPGQKLSSGIVKKATEDARRIADNNVAYLPARRTW